MAQRLIDAEKLKKSVEYIPWCDYEPVKRMIDEQPTVDAVEVVRCKDCEKCLVDNSEREIHLCMKRRFFPEQVNLMGYCSSGERREDG